MKQTNNFFLYQTFQQECLVMRENARFAKFLLFAKKPKAITVNFTIWPGKRQQLAMAATGAPSDP